MAPCLLSWTRYLGWHHCNGDLNVDKQEKINEAIEMAVRYGGIDGDHHKAWVIDQMVRILAGDTYDQVVADAKAGEDGPETYDWDVGIAP